MTTKTKNVAKITITDESGNACRNLTGVFRRAFPIAVMNAEMYGSETVSYCGARYTISAN